MGRPLDEDIIIKILESWQKAFKENSHYVSASDLSLVIKDVRELPTIQSVATDTNVGDKISKFIDGLEEIFADLRERHVDDSVCGLCEYDGAYMGQSGDWCNECPGFEKDDCFKLSDKTRKEWTEEIINAQPTIQPQSTTGQLNDGARSTVQSTDLIDRQAAIDAAKDWYEGLICGSINGLIKRLNALPSAQPERQRGERIEISSINHTYKCSECGRLLVNVTDGKNNVSKHYPYCHCGADMKGERQK